MINYISLMTLFLYARFAFRSLNTNFYSHSVLLHAHFKFVQLFVASAEEEIFFSWNFPLFFLKKPDGWWLTECLGNWRWWSFVWAIVILNKVSRIVITNFYLEYSSMNKYCQQHFTSILVSRLTLNSKDDFLWLSP